MKRLTFVVIAAALLWSGFWVFQSNVQKQAIAHWFENRRAKGWAADYTDLSVSGFPNRLDTTMTDPRLGDPESGMVWESGFLQLFRLSYNPKHIIAVVDNAQSYATPHSTLSVTTSDARASLKLLDTESWAVERMILVTEVLNAISDQDWGLSADVAQLSLEVSPDEPSDYRVALDVRGLRGTFPDIITTSGSNQAPIDRLTADVRVSMNAPLTRTAVESRRPQPQSLTVNLAEAQWSGLRLAAAGTLDITQSGTPVGTLTLKIRNWREMLTRERDAGRLTQSALDQIDFVLTLISGLAGNPETLDLPFDFKNGQIWLGPLHMGEAPRLILP